MSGDLNRVIPAASSSRPAGILGSVLVALSPLALLVVIVGIALILAALARTVFAAGGFFAQQQVAIIILVAGLVLAIVAYAVASFLILRRMAEPISSQYMNGGSTRASATLWTLAISTLVVLLPVLLALFLPQHPAP